MKSYLKYISIIIFISFLSSCGKECMEQRKILDTVDLKHIKPEGIYLQDKLLSEDKITFNVDSTATIVYTENDTTYEFTYKVTSIGTYESLQKKY